LDGHGFCVRYQQRHGLPKPLVWKRQHVKWLLAAALLLAPATKEYKYVCVRWAWYGDVFNRTVYCLKWQKVEK
jgi:hypothetical protein